MISVSSLSKVKYFAIRVEFQVRGSPHVHSFLWLFNQPVLFESNIDVFIDYLGSVATANYLSKMKIQNCSTLLIVMRPFHVVFIVAVFPLRGSS